MPESTASTSFGLSLDGSGLPVAEASLDRTTVVTRQSSMVLEQSDVLLVPRGAPVSGNIRVARTEYDQTDAYCSQSTGDSTTTFTITLGMSGVSLAGSSSSTARAVSMTDVRYDEFKQAYYVDTGQLAWTSDTWTTVSGIATASETSASTRKTAAP